MQLLNGADHFGNVINVASLNVAVATEAVVKRVQYIAEMSQNYECFNRRGVA
jgi:hypothetical protein